MVRTLTGTVVISESVKFERMLYAIVFICFIVPVLSDNRIHNVRHHINKCCRNGMGMNTTVIPKFKIECVNLTNDLFNDKQEIYNLADFIKTVNLSETFNVSFKEPHCNRYILHKFKMQEDGSLYVDTRNTNVPYKIFSPEQYCVDTFELHTKDGKDDGIKWRALLCSVHEEESHHELSSGCMLISCFFILLTVGVYAWLPELRNLHGMVLIAYLLSFFVGFLILAVLKINALVGSLPALYCYISSFIIYYSLLAAFFWLNVMCYDIWRTFSGVQGQQTRTSVCARFRVYCTYAFGSPALLTTLVAGLEFSDLDYYLLPNLRKNGCFFFKIGLLLYLYGPIAVLWTVNLIFFILTSVNIGKIKRETKRTMSTTDSSKNNSRRTDEQRFSLYIKLYAVMGLTWILEIVSYFYPQYNNTIWIFTDAYNVLLGLIIFIIFVCKKKTWRMLKNRYKKMRGLPLSQANTNTSLSSRTLASQSRDSIINVNSTKKA